MRPFVISTDTTADLPAEYTKEHGISIHPLHYLIDEKEYGMELGELTPHEFYQTMRDGKMPTTNATNLGYDIKLMEELAEQGNDILHISFSSQMSTSYNNARLAAEEVMGRHPGCRIVVFDSKNATCGLSVLIRMLVKMKENGSTLDEAAAWVEEVLPHTVCNFTLPDLFHMWRGGRLKKSSAVLGTALKIQPVLHINDEGALEPVKKVRGRSAAVKGLYADLARLCEEGKRPEMVCITHGDCPEETETLAETVRKEFQIEEVYISYLSPTLGAHSGPSTLTLGYIGEKK